MYVRVREIEHEKSTRRNQYSLLEQDKMNDIFDQVSHAPFYP